MDQNKAIGTILTVLFLIFLAVMLSGNWFFGTAAEELAAYHICAYVQVVYEVPCEQTWLVYNHMPELEICQSRLGSPDVEDAGDWARCLEDEGVRLR